VIGVVVGRWIRPRSSVAITLVVIVAVLAGLLAEGAALVVVGPPRLALEPTLAGFVMGGLAAFFSGTKPPRGDDKERS
jgi:hypothetical protein